jgi:hypothetical protein
MYGNGNIDLIVNDYHGKFNVYLLKISGQVIDEKVISFVFANRTYHCWEHYTQNSLLGTGWQQFSGLNAPLVNWYHIYFKPGNVYGGFNFWMKSKKINEDFLEVNLILELDELH